MRKLKGTYSKKLKGSDKKKKEDTLKKMGETREKDSQHLRDAISAKLLWAIAEKAKGEKVIKTTQVQVNRLEGIILFINDILKTKKVIEKIK